MAIKYHPLTVIHLNIHFLIHPKKNYSIITFQNTGRQPRYSTGLESLQTSKAFTISGVSIALYAELSLNEAKSDPNKKIR